MPSLAFTFTVHAERVHELQDLIAEVAAKPAGLVERARAAGYHREHMWLQPNPDGSVQYINNIDAPDDVDWTTITTRLAAFESDFTRWWDPRFGAIVAASSPGSRPMAVEASFAWDEDPSSFGNRSGIPA